MVELGTRRTTERVRVGHSPPTAARADILPDGAADKAAVQQVREGGRPHKSCRVNCPVRTRSDAGARER
jgi:hypothetical protein